jgi:hypothetical protein
LQRRASGNQGQGEKMDANLEAQDQAAIARHVEWLRAECAAVSLEAILPSGAVVEIFRDGQVTRRGAVPASCTMHAFLAEFDRQLAEAK